MRRLLMTLWNVAVIVGLCLATPSVARAQADDPAALKLAEPDFTLVALPTSLRLPKFGSAFRVTHRFTRPLNDGDFGDLAADLFGIDSGAQIGLEYRFGIIPNGQIGIHRTSDRTIELFAQYGLLPQGPTWPIDVSVLATIDGTNNFKDSYSPAIGAIVSRRFGDIAAVYVEPIWVNNTNQLPKELADHNDTFLIGVGARIRVRPTVYVVGELAPREPATNRASTTAASRSRSGPAGTRSSSTSRTRSARRWGRFRAAVRTATTGSWDSTSRASSTRMTGWCGGSSRRQHGFPCGSLRRQRQRDAAVTSAAGYDNHDRVGGVSPKNLVVGPGTQVTFVNNDSRNHEMTSDPHPEHTECPRSIRWTWWCRA